MSSKKHMLIILIVLLLSLGLTSAALAAANLTEGALSRNQPAAVEPRLTVNETHDHVQVEGEFNVPVTVTVAGKAVITGMTNNEGWFGSWEWGWNPAAPNIEPGDVITVEAAGEQSAVSPVGEISYDVDYEADIAYGTLDVPGFTQTLRAGCEVWDNDTPISIFTDTVQPDGGTFTCDYGAIGLDLHPEQHTVNLIYWEPDGDRVVYEYRQPHLEVNYAHDWAALYTAPWATSSISVNGAYTVTGRANGDGWFNSHEWPWDPEQPNLLPGDAIMAETVNRQLTVDPVGAIPITVDYDEDIVTGNIQAPWFSPLTLTVSCEIWVENGESIRVEGVDPDGGSFTCDFTDVGWDLQLTDQIAVRYTEPDGDSVINIFEPPWMRVNYGHNWVGGNYPAGHTFTITVTDESGDITRGVAIVESQPNWGWGNNDGFDTQDNWGPSGAPDIQVGDWVYIEADDGYTNTIQVGEVGGELDIATDSISGAIDAPWFSADLTIECHPWGAPGGAPGRNSSAGPDGDPTYFCQWDPNTEWDIQPGQEVAVMYIEPDLDRVMNVFSEPAPDLRLEMWTEGSMQVPPGGTSIFNIRYINNGDATADSFTISNTLPVSTSYAGDSSGITPTIGAGWVAWELGPLDPGADGRFQVFVTNHANPDDWLTNQAEVFLPFDRNWDNNRAEANASVVEGASDLGSGNLNPVPGDPTPGQTMLWEFDYGNNQPVASGLAVITGTLPLSTSVVDWYSQNGFGGWQEITSEPGLLVLGAPGIPGWWGDRLILQLKIDDAVAYGTQLTTTFEISTTNELSTTTGDNYQMRDDVWVNPPRWDVTVWKDLGWGVMVPGNELEYHLSFRNHGNMAGDVLLTDTLPAGTSFVEAWLNVDQTQVPFPPDSMVDGVVTWHWDMLEPGEYHDINVRLQIDPSTLPGTEIVNCAEIAIDGPDSWPYDNHRCLADTVRQAGPNLRVSKDHRWNWDGQLHYAVRLENIGTETFYGVTLTDTLPAGVTFNDSWSNNWGSDGVTMTNLGDQLVWTLREIQPGWNWWLDFDVDLDGNIGVQGLVFTNTIEAPLAEDIYPDDNYDEEIAMTGPDVFIEKWLSGGEPRPGEIITFTVMFGNHNGWPWSSDDQFGSHITDTLPAEMTYITSTAAWNPAYTWAPDVIEDNALIWNWGPMWSDSIWYYDIAVQITDSVVSGDVLTNVIEAYGDSPNDIEANWDNNVFALPITILAPAFEVSKQAETSMVAGTEVLYTLLVTNTGNSDGSGVVLSDTLPANLAYGGSDGTLSGEDVLWNFAAEPLTASIGPGASVSGWFSGTLACTAGLTVENAHYQVVASDQGIVSPEGDPVSFTIIEPTISVSFTQSAASIPMGGSVDFSAIASTDGTALTYAWDFGDDGSSTEAAPSHTYTNSGTYTVTLTVTDGCGYVETVIVTAAVTVDRLHFFLPVVFK
ncbi:MAG TPA: PKD domain-containing protein [Anaerolineales bacterium]|nr:PKD domain-containing protein [Anaerolineales bacterium]